MKYGKRILVISHGHPDIKKGGAEVASYNFFKELESRGEDAFYLACSEQLPHGGTSFSAHNSSREILFHTKIEDVFLYSNYVSRALWKEFKDLLEILSPDVIHFHHYVGMGIEALEVTRRTLANVKIVLTLHEYLAICHNKGLMIKTNSALCYRASPKDCSSCFPDKSPADFFLREKYLKRILNNVDKFVAPSNFLKNRYVEWGIDETKISVIENGLSTSTISTKLNIGGEDRIRFAFFGQLNPNKGVEILLEAISKLPKKIQRKAIFDIYGANLSFQPSLFQERISELLEKLKNIVSYHGAYEQNMMSKLISRTDWVIVPSTWWENSPMVIQEAFQHKVPVIVSDIGGMAEKVEHGKTGLHFMTGSSVDLVDVITYAVNNHSNRKEFVDAIDERRSVKQVVEQHFVLYG
jgi:glycosyltransferase involved in cell wall biosynthesis